MRRQGYFNWVDLGVVLLIALTLPEMARGQDHTGADQALVNGDGQQREQGICGGVILIPLEGPEAPRATQQAPFSIVPTFGAGVTAARQVVLQQAVNEWSGIIETNGVNPNNYSITFSYGSLPPGVLGQASTFVFLASGNLSHTDIVFSPDFTWFEDPTPADDSEFDPFGPPGFDLLSVARHEIGHAVGWVGSFSVRVGIHMSGSTFDPPRMNIATVDDGAHAGSAHPGDLMRPSTGPSTRRAISPYPDEALVARAFFYNVTMRFLDRNFGGSETGSANNPWNSVGEAFAFTPAGIPMLLTPGTYVEAVPITRSTATTLLKARGGNVVITGP